MEDKHRLALAMGYEFVEMEDGEHSEKPASSDKICMYKGASYRQNLDSWDPENDIDQALEVLEWINTKWLVLIRFEPNRLSHLEPFSNKDKRVITIQTPVKAFSKAIYQAAIQELKANQD